MPRLHEAVAAGDIESVQEYIVAGDDVNDRTTCLALNGEVYSRTKHGKDQPGRFRTPLNLAAYHGHVQIIKILVGAQALVDKPECVNTAEGATSFEIAMSMNNLGCATVLKNLGAKDKNNALEQALANRDIKLDLRDAVLNDKAHIIADIFESGSMTKELGERTLVFASKNEAINVSENLLLYGVSPDASFNDQTALGAAAKLGAIESVVLLLDMGAAVDKLTFDSDLKQKCTPLLGALLHVTDTPAKPDLIQLLLKNGAKLDLIEESSFRQVLCFGKAEELEVLLQHGLDPNIFCHQELLVELCFRFQRYDLATLLIKYGAYPFELDANGRSYLHKCGTVALAQQLLTSGLDIDLKDDFGMTALQTTEPAVAQFLLVKKQAPARKILQQFANVEGDSSTTVLHKLVLGLHQNGYMEKIKCLLESGLITKINQAGYYAFPTNQPGVFNLVSDNWTILHEAFANIQIFDSEGFTEVALAQHGSIQVIDLLIKHGALPLLSRFNRTPLMNLPIKYTRQVAYTLPITDDNDATQPQEKITINLTNKEINKYFVNRYYKIEAAFHKIDEELYKKELLRLIDTAFKATRPEDCFFKENRGPKRPVELFWEHIRAAYEEVVPNQPLNEWLKLESRTPKVTSTESLTDLTF